MTEKEFLGHHWFRVNDKDEATLNVFEGIESKEEAIEWAKLNPSAKSVDEFIGNDYKDTVYNKTGIIK